MFQDRCMCTQCDTEKEELLELRAKFAELRPALLGWYWNRKTFETNIDPESATGELMAAIELVMAEKVETMEVPKQ